jgi:hypothetical protein
VVATPFIWAIKNFAGSILRIGIVKAQQAVKIHRLSLFHGQNFRLTPLRTVPARMKAKLCVKPMKQKERLFAFFVY